MVQFALKLDLKGFDRKVYNAIKQKLKPKLNKVANKVSIQIQNRFRSLLFEHKTINTLISGSTVGGVNLQGELGVNNPAGRIEIILDSWIRNHVLILKPLQVTERGITGGFRFQMIRSDWQEVFNLNASIITEFTKETLPWLQWLLVEGDKVVIQEYDFAMQFGTGRTGKGHMRKWKRRRWNVPPEFAGTQENNFVSDIVEDLHKELGVLIKKEFIKII